MTPPPSRTPSPPGPSRPPANDTAHDPFAALGADELRRRGSLKWTGTDHEIAAWVAESDFGAAPAVTSALHAAVDRAVLGYLPPAVRSDLSHACADWHRDRYGWDVDPGWVHPVGDVLAALRIAVEQFSRPGSPIILPTPAYMPFLTAPRLWGREVVEVPMVEADGRTTPDLDALGAAFRAGGHLLVLINPHNPTGRVMSRSELVALADVVDSHGGRVFSDEIHAPLTRADVRHLPYASVSPAAAGHTVTATSASKAWNLAGLKCAQVILSNATDASTWARHDHLLTEGAATLGAIANTAAYRDGRQWLDGVLRYLDGNRQAFASAVSGAQRLHHREPEGTYLAWVDLRDVSGETATLASRLRRETGVAVVDGAACGAAGQGFVRVNLAMPRPLVVEAGRRISEWSDRAR